MKRSEIRGFAIDCSPDFGPSDLYPGYILLNRINTLLNRLTHIRFKFVQQLKRW